MPSPSPAFPAFSSSSTTWHKQGSAGRTRSQTMFTCTRPTSPPLHRDSTSSPCLCRLPYSNPTSSTPPPCDEQRARGLWRTRSPTTPTHTSWTPVLVITTFLCHLEHHLASACAISSSSLASSSPPVPGKPFARVRKSAEATATHDIGVTTPPLLPSFPVQTPSS